MLACCQPMAVPATLPKCCAGLDDDAYVFVNNLMDLLDSFDPEVPQLLGNAAYSFGASSNPTSGQAAKWPMPLAPDLSCYANVKGLTLKERPPTPLLSQHNQSQRLPVTQSGGELFRLLREQISADTGAPK